MVLETFAAAGRSGTGTGYLPAHPEPKNTESGEALIEWLFSAEVLTEKRCSKL